MTDPLKSAENAGRFVTRSFVYHYPILQTLAQDVDVMGELPIYVSPGNFTISELRGHGALVLAGARLIVRIRNALGATTIADVSAGTFTVLGLVLAINAHSFVTGDLLTIEIQKTSPQSLVPFSLSFLFSLT